MRGIAAVLILLPLADSPLAADDIQSWTDIELRVLDAGRARLDRRGRRPHSRRAGQRVRPAGADRRRHRVERSPDRDVRLHPAARRAGRFRLRLEPPPARGIDLSPPAGGRPAGRHDAVRTPRRPAGRPRFQPLPAAARRRAPPRPGVPMALPVGGVRTPGLRALPLADGRPLALHRGSLGARAPTSTSRSGKARAGGPGTPSTRSGASI